MGRERAFEPDTDSEEHRVPKAARERDSPAADAIVSQALIDAVRVSHAAGQTRLPLQPSQILALQATRGNEFVQRRLRSGAAPEAVEPGGCLVTRS